MKKKLSKALQILHQQGMFSGFKYFLFRILEDKWLFGKLIELRGNTGSLEGSSFFLDSPYITTRLKSRFLLQTWEVEARYLMNKYLPNDLPLIEFGSNMGVVSCISNKLLTTRKAHVVVEANKNIIPILERNRENNGCRFKIVNAAVAYGTEEISFYLAPDINEGSTGSTGSTTSQSITVPTTTLEAILQQEGFSRVSLICDIEGAEMDLLANEGDVLSNRVEWIVMEMHGQEGKAHAYLEALGFDLIEVFNHNCIYHNHGPMAEKAATCRKEEHMQVSGCIS